MAKILIVAPHPDDEVLGCGGTMAKYSESGYDVHVLIITKGEPDMFDPSLVKQVRKEAGKAHKILGVKETYFADLPSVKLDTLPLHKIIDTISEFIDEIKPAILFMFDRQKQK